VDVPLPTSHESGKRCKLPHGGWRPRDLERFIGLGSYKAASGVDFADIN